MSHTFELRAARPPRTARVIDRLRLPDLRCDADAPATSEWPENHLLHFYRDGASTRSTEVLLENGVISVRVMALAAPEDWELALRFVEAFAAELGTDVESEGLGALPAAELRARHDEAWVRGQVSSGARVLAQLAAEGKDVRVPGAVRPFCVGRRLLAELREEGDLADTLVARMRRVQYVEREGYRAVSALEVSGEHEKFTFAVWGPEDAILVPDVRYVFVDASGQEAPAQMLFVPPAAVLELAGERARFIDEKQLLVDAFQTIEWPRIVEKARGLRTDPVRS